MSNYFDEILSKIAQKASGDLKRAVRDSRHGRTKEDKERNKSDIKTFDRMIENISRKLDNVDLFEPFNNAMNNHYFQNIMCKNINRDFCSWNEESQLYKMKEEYGGDFDNLIDLFQQYYKANAKNLLAERKMANWMRKTRSKYVDKAPQYLKDELSDAIYGMRNIKSRIVNEFGFKSTDDFFETYDVLMKDFQRTEKELFEPKEFIDNNDNQYPENHWSERLNSTHRDDQYESKYDGDDEQYASKYNDDDDGQFVAEKVIRTGGKRKRKRKTRRKKKRKTRRRKKR